MSNRGYRRMAAAVIVDAVQDYKEARLTLEGSGRGRIVSKENRKSAVRFLRGRELDFWASAAGVDAEALRDKVLKLEPVS